MGIAFNSIIDPKEIELDYLSNKVIVIDAHNVLYQFLTTIRGADGSLLTDSKGRVTSHLVGLFGRTTNLMQKNIKLAFVFDGKPPKLKEQTRENRRKIKEEAKKKLDEAIKKEDAEGMKKFSSRTTVLTSEMISEAKQFLTLLGVPVIQAPSEGEAQASHIVKRGDAYAVGSQDYDSLVNGATKLVRNLSIAGKRKKGAFSHQIVKPHLIELSQVLNSLGLDQDQLIAASMIIGTDYNPQGIKGLGPKNAIKLAKKHGSNFDELFKEAKWEDHFDVSWNEVFDTIKNIPVSDEYDLNWSRPNSEGLNQFLVEERNFSSDRLQNTLAKIEKEKSSKSQTSLSDF